MSETTEPVPLGSRTTLFRHALRLHQQTPDSPLPRDGAPFPDEERHRGKRPRTRADQRLDGADVAAILDRHFADPDARAGELVDAFHDVLVPFLDNAHVNAAALRADRQRVRHTGRWLVRHSTDRCSAVVGLALLASDWTEEDIPLIQTIGLLSHTFGPLAAEALGRRRGGGEALQWLGQRVTGWGRVHVIEKLCGRGGSTSRGWLLRNACDGDFLNAYFAGQVATATHLHEAITGTDIDDDLVDHTGRVLRIMTDCDGMGTTLEHYPPAPVVLAAHAAHLGRQAPTRNRYLDAAVIAYYLTTRAPAQCGCTTGQRDEIVRQYLAVLNRRNWCDTARANLDRNDESVAWFAIMATRLNLRAFGP
ncbi:hypothetical protein [Actinophytocola oryzae]|uniref:Uncharacterized protein n=1 Tax=Actinophytocola oryzae TaxID=502181 RepID=A0A4V3FUR7_9PSEU|nr:hypothetical protein [Actinophytocola oryzae]TDV56261.1 hypothetical protein CLV71_102327 [Actinophytocola oryzae]